MSIKQLVLTILLTSILIYSVNAWSFEEFIPKLSTGAVPIANFSIGNWEEVSPIINQIPIDVVVYLLITALVVMLSTKFDINPTWFIVPPLLLIISLLIEPSWDQYLRPFFLSSIVLMIVGLTCGIYQLMINYNLRIIEVVMFLVIIGLFSFQIYSNIQMKELKLETNRKMKDLENSLSSLVVPYTQQGEQHFYGGALSQDANRHKEEERYVQFTTPFLRTPIITISFCGLDTFRGENIRFYVKLRSATPQGFTFYFYTWANSVVYGAQFCWTASGFTNIETVRKLT